VEIALIALAISPVPPVLPKKETKAGGSAAFALGLMAILSLLSIIVVPAALDMFGRFAGREFAIAPGSVSIMVLKAALAPLALGMVLRAMLPSVAERLQKPAALIAKVLGTLAVLALLFSALPAIWELIGNGSVFLIALFVVAGLAVGHVFGGPDPDQSIVLGLSTACRHPGIAFAVASTNFPDQQFGAAILLYLLVSAIVCLPYLSWQRRHRLSLSQPSPAR
jgi:BASS family bile acid:Na+ symporter